MAGEFLKRATVIDTTSEPATAEGTISALTVCHDAVTHRNTIAVAGVQLAWRQVRLAGWCWGGGHITSWKGSDYSKWTAFPYCFSNESNSDGWYNSPTRRLTHTRGQVGNNTPVGCITSQTLDPAIYYRDGGSFTYTP